MVVLLLVLPAGGVVLDDDPDREGVLPVVFVRFLCSQREALLVVRVVLVGHGHRADKVHGATHVHIVVIVVISLVLSAIVSHFLHVFGFRLPAVRVQYLVPFNTAKNI
uniref:(northern house mosquito) hypothetical protein n=1 Tax=Culex pipiens TaxID=7175 RepID=A0A8D8H071_CULPI